MLKKIKQSWGSLRVIWNSSVFYIQLIQFGTILILGYDQSIRARIYNIFGVEISLIGFLILIFIFLIAFMIFEHKISIPNINRYSSTVFYNSGPFKGEFEKLHAEIEALNTKIAELQR